MSCWEEVRELLAESREDNIKIGALEYKLKSALERLEKADNLLRRANAEIAMLNARIEHGSGADKLVLCDALYLMFDAARRGLVPFTDKHLAEVRNAAKG